jgi:prepilin-type N-terminal cleavage/methylation domain-containing protein
MRGTVTKRLLREEKGFSLAEVMVTIVIMLVVLFALYSIFDMSIRIFGVGNDKTEAIENARLGLEKMEREIRAAYPQDKAAGNSALFYSWQPSSISFGNNLNNNYVVDSATEQITYDAPLSGTTLRRTVGAGSSQPVVEFVREVDTLNGGSDTDGDTTPLTFTYCKKYDDDTDEAEAIDGCPTDFDVATSEASIRLVRIKLEVAVDEARDEEYLSQVLTTDVALRNRGQ